MSVRLRLTIFYAAVMAATLVVSSILLYVLLDRSLVAETDAFLASKANDLAASAQVLEGLLIRQVTLPNLDRFAEGDVYLQVTDDQGRVVGKSENLSLGELPLSREGLSGARRGEATYSTASVHGVELRVYATPLIVRGQTAGVLLVARSVARLEAARAALRNLLFLGNSFLLVLAAVAGWFLAGSSLRPISRITRTAQAIENSQQLGQRVQHQGPKDEVGELADTFNSMLDRLESAFEAQRRFVSDASHELRTPLTALRLNVEMLRKDTQATPAQRAELVEDIAKELDRMSRLVQGLLDLARADAGFPIEKAPLRADELLLEVHRQARPLTDGIALELSVDQPLTVMGNADYLKQLLITLLDNALKYTPSGGKVRLCGAVEDGWVKLTVSDTGPGIASEDLPHIFERFYRARSVRNRRGTGLGLAVARWIAEEHGGRITVDSQPGHGSSFCVWLPRSQI